MEEDKCKVNHCRGHSAITVLGYVLCAKHWEDYCDWSDNHKGGIEVYLKKNKNVS